MSSVKFIKNQLMGADFNKSLANKRRSETLLDLQSKLDKYGKCALVRCTGFGKTWMLTSILRQYKKVLYLYPADVIKSTVVDRHNQVELGVAYSKENNYSEDSVKNTTFLSYCGLVKLTDSEFRNMNYDLVIFDECHRLGALKTKVCVSKLFRYLPDAKYIGATATPERGDSFDVIDRFFDNICGNKYTLHDAIQDCIIKKPYYIFCRTDIESDLRSSVKESGISVDGNSVNEIIQKRIIEAGNLFNMDNIIKDTLKEYKPNCTYFKFIVFYPTLESISEKSGEVEGWFKKALGVDYKVRSLVISSASKKETGNVSKLNKLVDDGSKRIDFIHCINMLNMGYHVSDLTGIVMMRGTSSSIIFNQQLGRALSTGNSEPCVVFDVVDNLQRKAAFELVSVKDLKLRKRRKLVSEFRDKYTINEVQNMADDDIVPLAEKYLEDDEGVIIETINNEGVLSLRKRLIGLLDNSNVQWWKFCNTVTKEDIVLTGFEATYREFIAKVVAEPISFKVKSAIANHYLLYCSLRNKPTGLSTTEAYSTRSMQDAEFMHFLRQVVVRDHSDYPIFSSKKFKQAFVDTNEEVLSQLLRHYNVTINEVLRLLSIDDKEKREA